MPHHLETGEMSPTDPAFRSQPYDHNDDDYGLSIVAKHNNLLSESHAAHHDVTQNSMPCGTTPHSPQQDGSRFDSDVLTPQSNVTSEGVRTRSWRSTRSTESPYSIVKSSASKSPATRTKREKKSKLDKSKMPKITAPLSVLTNGMDVPLKDIEAWVNRPVEQRRQEVEKRNGYVTRPMNSFMLYRSAFAERTKQWCLQNNHQIVSSVSGVSWPMEPPEIRHQYDEWAKVERANHQAAHPTYKFSPSKSTTKRRKTQYSDDEDEVSDADTDPDGEYRGSKTNRQRKQAPSENTAFLPTSHPFDTLPYYSHPENVFDPAQYQVMNPTPTLPSNYAYDPNESPYMVRTHSHIPASTYPHVQYPYTHNTPEVRALPSSSPSGSQSLGRYGLPSNQSQDALLYGSRTSSPVQSYGQYIQPLYPQHTSHSTHQPTYMGVPMMPTKIPMYAYEHQRYLQQASEPRVAIDPTLEAAMATAANGGVHEGISGQSHFDDALGDLSTQTDLSDSHDYYVRSVSPSDVNATLAPTWMPDDL